MHRIYKFRLEITNFQEVEMPEGAEILSVQNQSNYVTLWALCDGDRAVARRGIWIYGTGHQIDPLSELDYIGTVQQFDGTLVWHVFDVGERN